MPALETSDLIVRIVLASLLGGLIGLERELSDQPAGFRTHILVSLGAALFTLAGAYGLGDFTASGDGVRLNLDPTRVAAQIVTGIGFLGAGAIIQQGFNVRGLTTAASLWVTAAIGMAVGFGYVAGALVAAVTALAALILLRVLERSILVRLKRGRTRLVIDTDPGVSLTDMASSVEAAGALLDSVKVLEGEGGGQRLVAVVHLQRGRTRTRVVEALRDLPGVQNVDTDF